MAIASVDASLRADARTVAAAERPLASAPSIILKTLITHTITYFAAGFAAYTLLDYPTLLAQGSLAGYMRPLTDPMVMAGPLLQPVRGALFGLIFYMLREPFFGRKRGWLTMWAMLVGVGILGTFGAPPGSIEGMIYTVLPLSRHFTLLPEGLVQSLLLSWIAFQWVNHPGKKWLNWLMGVVFVLMLLMPVMGLIAGGKQ